jgi:hypothetical protein
MATPATFATFATFATIPLLPCNSFSGIVSWEGYPISEKIAWNQRGRAMSQTHFERCLIYVMHGTGNI